MRRTRVGCKIRWLKFRISSNKHWMYGMELPKEPMNLHRKNKFLHLNSRADQEVEGQGTNCVGLSQIK